jgi:peptidoglycan/LPS O-acetylase OafA/YrhL
MVTYYALWKGRCTSPQLLLLLRRVNALLLASGMLLLPGWLPSEINPADAPSRAYIPTEHSLNAICLS